MIGEFAIIMSIREKKAVALAPGGRFFQIKNRDFHVGQRIILEPSLFTPADRVGFAIDDMKGKIRRITDRLLYKGMIILSGFLILIPTTSYAATKYVPWTYVSLDTGNVSIQYQLNARGEVLSTETHSEEGQAVVDSLTPVRYEKVEDAMDRALSIIYSDESPDTEDNGPLTIGISTRFGDGERTINAISGIMEENPPVPITFEHLDWSETGRAREEDISIGQYSRKMSVQKGLEPDDRPNIPEEPLSSFDDKPEPQRMNEEPADSKVQQQEISPFEDEHQPRDVHPAESPELEPIPSEKNEHPMGSQENEVVPSDRDRPQPVQEESELNPDLIVPPGNTPAIMDPPAVNEPSVFDNAPDSPSDGVSGRQESPDGSYHPNLPSQEFGDPGNNGSRENVNNPRR